MALYTKAVAEVEQNEFSTENPFPSGWTDILDYSNAAALNVPHVWEELRSGENGNAYRGPNEQGKPLSLLKSLRDAFAVRGPDAVDSQLKYSYYGILASREGVAIDKELQHSLLDFRSPLEWYPRAREIQRVIHVHVGPTNSGKTYHALKSLEKATSGIYAGPLRLLAFEVFHKLNQAGTSCDLATGDEQIQTNTSSRGTMVSCTVEMVPLNRTVDVAVIDEIQMIGHEFRGWAWTQALLGVKAKEVHLCGEERALPLIRDLVAMTGDRLEVHNYSRLSPLRTMTESLYGDLRGLQKGDCVVVFSALKIHALKSQIELMTNKRVAVVYGSLPPEVRSQQAGLFNDPENDYDFLVASDAIGMGLNLAIKRIIFESLEKSNGFQYEPLAINEIKQIAGRAGRYRVDQRHNMGLVTTLTQEELPHLRKAMETEAAPIRTAGLLPTNSMIHKFASHFPPSINFGYVLQRLHELAIQSPRFHLCNLKEQLTIADVIRSVPGLSTRDRIIFCHCPFSSRDSYLRQILIAYANCVADNQSGEILKIPELQLGILDQPETLEREYIWGLMTLHKGLVMYLWLSYRFTGCFIDRQMAFYIKKLAEEKVDRVLNHLSDSPDITRRILRARTKPGVRERYTSTATDTVESLLQDTELVELLEETSETSKESMVG